MSGKHTLGSIIISLVFVLITKLMDNRTSLYFLLVALIASGLQLASGRLITTEKVEIFVLVLVDKPPYA